MNTLHAEAYRTEATSAALAQTWAWEHDEALSSLRATSAPLAVFGADIETDKVAFIDCDDVLRETGAFCVSTYANDPTLRSIRTNLYGQAGGSEAEIDTLVRWAVHDGGVPLPADHREIREELQELRTAGVATVLTTAIIEGCEQGLAQFLSRYYPDCFTGMIFTRNHSGENGLTKSLSVRTALGHVGMQASNLEVAMVDDSPWHVLGFLADKKLYRDVHVAVPQHAGNGGFTGLEGAYAPTTSDALRLVRKGMGL